MSTDRVIGEVVEAIAAREGVDSLELDPPLYEVVDADALEAIVAANDDQGRRPNVRVSFTYRGYDVTVAGRNRVSIREPAAAERDEGPAAGGAGL